jgi:hypothetical protein
MKLSDLKDGECVLITRGDFEQLKQDAFKCAVGCLQKAISEKFSNADAMNKEIGDLILNLFQKHYSEVGN